MSSALIRVQPLLAALSAVVGQPIELNEQGACGLEFDNEVEIAIALAPGSDFLAVRAPLMYPGQVPTACTFHEALALNFAHLPPGCAVALDEATEQLVLMSLLSAQALTQDAFLGLLADFVALVPELRSRLAVQPGLEPMGGTVRTFSDSWN